MVHSALPPVLRHVMMGWRLSRCRWRHLLLPRAVTGAAEASRSLQVGRGAHHGVPGGGAGPRLGGAGLAGGLGGDVGLGVRGDSCGMGLKKKLWKRSASPLLIRREWKVCVCMCVGGGGGRGGWEDGQCFVCWSYIPWMQKLQSPLLRIQRYLK